MKTVKLSGTIGLDLMASDFDESLRGAAGEDIEIAIASPGGSVFDGIEIYNSIREHKRNNPGAKITIRIVGLAASMASYIASVDAADKVIAEDNAVFMIHNPWIAAVGDHREMAKNSEFLKGLSNILAQSYARKTKKSISAINGMMDAETWLYGDEIKEAGFVDEIIQSTEGSQASSKTTALALAKTRFSDSLAKIKRNADAEQEKAAAMLPAFFAGSGEPRMTETKATIDPMQAAINEALLAKLTEELGRSQGIEPLRPGRIAGAEYLEDEPEIIAFDRAISEAVETRRPFLEWVLAEKKKADEREKVNAEQVSAFMESLPAQTRTLATVVEQPGEWKPGEIEEV